MVYIHTLAIQLAILLPSLLRAFDISVGSRLLKSSLDEYVRIDHAVACMSGVTDQKSTSH